jgi:hypothetical protein
MKKIILYSIILFITFTACKKDDFIPADATQIITTEDLKISDTFNWKTTRDINLTVSGNDNGVVEITNTDNIPYLKFFLQAGVSSTMKLTVPAFEKSVQIKFMGQNIKLELTDTDLSYQF